MADADVIIIGGGIAGLTCACLLAKQGLRILLIEKNQKVGGCCTSFEKDGFSFDLSFQSIGECQNGGRIWDLLKKLDFLDQVRFVSLEKVETTRRTIELWTGNRWGSAYGWAQIPSQSGIYRLSRTTPFTNLYLTGHWTSPGGGIAGVVASGELTAEAFLRKFEEGEF